MNLLLDLPESLLNDVLEYVTIYDHRVLLAACRELWNKRHALESRIGHLVVHDERDFLILSDLDFLGPMIHLQSLDLQNFCTDSFLHSLGEHPDLLPNLLELRLVGSLGVSDAGLASLSLGCQSLTHLDITFCRNTTYSGTFCLRSSETTKRVIRRQPAWMDGKFQTPFDNDGVHTYWCDGTFQFDRATQSCGFVCDLEIHNNDYDHLADKLQYNNFEPPGGWPAWSRFCYRPGVSLLKLPDWHDGKRQVLVGQHLYGLWPPTDIPMFDHVPLVDVGASIYFGKDGAQLPENHPVGDRYTMVSRMTVLPLEELMPPDDIVSMNKTFCDEMKNSQQVWSLEGGEEFLHHVLRRD
jgi:hypothetical protein